ncbi:MAG: bifunctional [glutamate--ammonia ligase]-adenylyl-L-tyrosine phosphorylase/[glutamate--ammonia-ligase] adenylyltransferase [Deltaproteobacteria bacterium]
MSSTPPARSQLELLAGLGVADRTRTLSLLEEIRRRIPWEDPFWIAVGEAAREAPDPDLFFLNLSRLCDSLPPREVCAAFAPDGSRKALGRLLGASESIPERLAARPELVSRLFAGEGFRTRIPAERLAAEAMEAADRCGTEEEVQAALRGIRIREFTAIAARDLAGLSPLPEVTEDLSNLAAAALEGAIRFARRLLDERYGVPRVGEGERAGRECRFVVLGMGKLGARELNVSSDIDLIYLYETDRGTTDGGSGGKAIPPHPYFVRLCETITRIVSENTADGLVFRVDLRLRPDGSKGALAHSLRAAETYYESWGQTWERGAMIKARPVAGDLGLGEEFLGVITPFVYRRSLDFTAIEEIQELKDRVDRTAARSRERGMDVKLGHGGIREIEFFVQTHQLVYGGKDPSLRLRGTEETLAALSAAGIVPEGERKKLVAAYRFLRSLEHRIQYHRERQTHLLPEREGDRRRIARAMGFADAAEFLAALKRHTAAVREAYGRLFRPEEERTPSEVSPEVEALFERELEGEELDGRLRALGFSDPAAAAKHLAALREGPPFTRLPVRARRYLEKIAPRVLQQVTQAPDPDMALGHMERFLSAMGARTMFYALLFENRKVIDVLVRLFGRSRYLSGYLLRHPEMLDTFLRKDLSPLVRSKSEMRKELGEALGACADFEEEMDELRRFKNAETLRIGLHDLAGNLSPEEGMFQLSALAEVLLGYALVLARRETSNRYGVPMTAGEDGPVEARFCVMGMGKLGGEELTYHSDLDILFLYQGSGETAPRIGVAPETFRKLSNHEYFAKVAQRLISILSTSTREGYVYKLDTRLRPSGNAGPLVSSREAFARYHEASAQLWERQALLKCRFVAGDRDFGKRMEQEIARFLFDRPLPGNAAEEIHRLRTRMEKEIGRERADRLDLKVGRGGIVDVEFAVQYLQLRHGPAHPAVRARATLKALYELHRAGILPEEEFRVLDEGYRFLRSLEVGLRLSQDASIERFDPGLLEPETRERYREVTERIRQIYLRILGIAE